MYNYISDDETTIETNTTLGDTDNENDTDDEFEDDGIVYEDFYEYDELSRTKYNLVLCEKYNKLLHGIIDGEINNHYLTHFRLKNINNHFIEIVKLQYPNVRTEIAECLILNSDHCVSIIKTFWLRLIQRTWKKICNERKNIIKKRSKPTSILYREIFGQWPDDCLRYPLLRGMMSNLLT